MELNFVVVALLITVLALAQVAVGQLQQQQHRQSFYPAAGQKPVRQLPLKQPSRTYGAPVNAPAPNPAIEATQPKPARLVANSEAQEDIDDAVEQVPVNKAVTATQPSPSAPPSAIVQPTIAYYPAQFGGFIQPTAFARITAAPVPVPVQTSPYIAKYPYYAAYFG